MKKASVIFLAFLISLSMAACSNSTDIPGKPSYEELESQLEIVTSERDSLKTELDELRSKLEEKEAESKIQQEDVTILVTNKTVTPKNADQWIFSNYVNFVFSITNNTQKDIQGIQGELIVYDLFDSEIMSISCDFTGETIGAGATIVRDDLSFECNEFINEHMKLFNEDYKDLKFNYTIKKIVFTDGFVKTQ